MSRDTGTCGCDANAECGAATATATQETFRRPVYTATEATDAFHVEVFVPGVSKAGVEVALEDDVLAITARRTPAKTEGWRPLRQEIPNEDFHLTLRLNVPVNADKIEATVEDGVLHLVLPKAEEVKARRVEVK